MATKKKTTTTAAAAPAEEDDEAPTAKKNRGRHVPQAGFIYKNFGEDAAAAVKDWPRAFEQQFPLLQALFHEKGASLRDYKGHVTRLTGGAQTGGETPLQPAFDLSLIDTEDPEQASQQYMEDYYHLPSCDGPATYRITVKDKKTKQMVITAEIFLDHPKKIENLRRVHGMSVAPYAGDRPPGARPEPTGIGNAPNGGSTHHDPYTMQALQDLRVELATQKAQTPEIIAGTLKALGIGPNGVQASPTPAATQAAAPTNLKEEIVVGVVEALKLLGVAQTVGPAKEDSIKAIVDRLREGFQAKDAITKMIADYVPGYGEEKDGASSTTTSAPDVTTTPPTPPTPPAEPKAGFRGVKVEGAPKWKDGRDVLWPVNEKGELMLTRFPATNPYVVEALFDALKEAGPTVMQMLANIMANAMGQPPAPVPTPETKTETKTETNGVHVGEVVDKTPNDARDAGYTPAS